MHTTQNFDFLLQKAKIRILAQIFEFWRQKSTGLRYVNPYDFFENFHVNPPQPWDPKTPMARTRQQNLRKAQDVTLVYRSRIKLQITVCWQCTAAVPNFPH